MAEGGAGAGGAPPERPIREIETKSTRLPVFYGVTGHKDDITPRAFVSRIEAYCRSTNKAVNAECHEMCMLLRGSKTISWWESLEEAGFDVRNWQLLKEEFLKDFDYRIQKESAFQLLNLRQKVGESIVEYFARVSHAVADMSRGLLEVEEDEEEKATLKKAMKHVQKNLFISGMRESLKTAVLRTPPASLEDAKEAGRKAEFIEGQKGSQTSVSISAIETNRELSEMLESIMSLDTPEEEDQEDQLQEQEIAVINNWRRSRGRRPLSNRFNTRRRTGGPAGPFSGKCHNCDKVGHMARYCKAPRNPRAVRSMDDEPTQQGYTQGNMSSIKNW